MLVRLAPERRVAGKMFGGRNWVVVGNAAVPGLGSAVMEGLGSAVVVEVLVEEVEDKILPEVGLLLVEVGDSMKRDWFALEVEMREEEHNAAGLWEKMRFVINGRP